VIELPTAARPWSRSPSRCDGEWVLIHRCAGCGVLHSNRSAGDDNPLLLVRLAVKPLAQPPFPLDRLALI
jgi:RNHCP domain